jgi:hypothetical protein
MSRRVFFFEARRYTRFIAAAKPEIPELYVQFVIGAVRTAFPLDRDPSSPAGGCATGR